MPKPKSLATFSHTPISITVDMAICVNTWSIAWTVRKSLPVVEENSPANGVNLVLGKMRIHKQLLHLPDAL